MKAELMGGGASGQQAIEGGAAAPQDKAPQQSPRFDKQ